MNRRIRLRGGRPPGAPGRADLVAGAVGATDGPSGGAVVIQIGRGPTD